MPSSNLQIREDEQPPEANQKQIQDQRGGGASDVKKVLLHLDRINQFPGHNAKLTMITTKSKNHGEMLCALL